MSSALAIASVTAVLRDLLRDKLIDHDLPSEIADVMVSALPPDEVDTSNNASSRLNLFLYQVTHNTGWRNVGLPSRNGGGQRVSNPPLALDLHYLLTAYGNGRELHTEILLGYGMQILHETPVLTRREIRKALAPPSPALAGAGQLPTDLLALYTSELAEQVEQIKIVPQSLSTEEISRLWAAFGGKYRPTVAYQASVVLIESRATTRVAPPVREPLIYVMPFRQPVIEEIKSAESPQGPILARHTLVITGRQLRGDNTRVNIGGVTIRPAPDLIQPNQITVNLASVTSPNSLKAGLQGVQVVHQYLLSKPAELHSGVESNLSAFVLAPEIQNSSVDSSTSEGTTPQLVDLRRGNLRIGIMPSVAADQRVLLLLNGIVSTSTEGLAYSFAAASRLNLETPSEELPDPVSELTIAFSRVRAGRYAVRVQVDGAQSPLIRVTDAQIASGAHLATERGMVIQPILEIG